MYTFAQPAANGRCASCGAEIRPDPETLTGYLHTFTNRADCHPRSRGRVFDHGRWYRDGFAPFQISGPLTMTCGSCGQDTLVVFSDTLAVCAICSPVLIGD